MQELRLTSPIPPSVNHYLAYRVITKAGRPMAMSYKTKEAKDYQKAFTAYVQEEAKKQGWSLDENKFQHYYVDCYFYFDRTDKDANNYMKCSLDAITDAGCVWIDDTQVCERVQRIVYDSQNPRIEFVIHPVEYVGIFDNEADLKEFTERCKTCPRYQRNCSILNKSLEGRIIPDVVNGTCLKFKEKK